MTSRNVLLVSPVFHGYWAALKAALEVNGHEVAAHCYDFGQTKKARLRNALAHRGIGIRQRHRNRAEATENAIKVLHAVKPDAVLVVKGDALEAAFWDAVQAHGAPVVLWLYDELSRMDYSYDQLQTIDSVVSYSPNDVAMLADHGVDAALLADGFDSLTRYLRRTSSAVNFVGARYPERERIVRKLVEHGISVETYGREWSRHPWDVIRTGQFRGGGAVGFRDIPRADYYGVMAGSLATLNIHGDGHDGLSMRTFEAPGVGGLQLIDRPSVATFYEPGVETLLYESDDQLIEHVKRAQTDVKWANVIREAGRRRTLAEHTLVHRMKEVERRWG